MNWPWRRQFGFWFFLLTGGVVLGFDPERDGIDGVKELVRRKFADVRQITTGELAAWLTDTNRIAPQLLDIREAKEFAQSHLPGARHVEPDTRPAKVIAQLATNRPVVVYCSVGYRSSEMARRLMNAGLTNVVNLDGSIFQWANEDRPLVNGAGSTAKVHPYNQRWSTLLKPAARGTAE